MAHPPPSHGSRMKGRKLTITTWNFPASSEPSTHRLGQLLETPWDSPRPTDPGHLLEWAPEVAHSSSWPGHCRCSKVMARPSSLFQSPWRSCLGFLREQTFLPACFSSRPHPLLPWQLIAAGAMPGLSGTAGKEAFGLRVWAQSFLSSVLPSSRVVIGFQAVLKSWECLCSREIHLPLSQSVSEEGPGSVVDTLQGQWRRVWEQAEGAHTAGSGSKKTFWRTWSEVSPRSSGVTHGTQVLQELPSMHWEGDRAGEVACRLRPSAS